MYSKILVTAALACISFGSIAQKDKRTEEEIIIEKKKDGKQEKTIIKIDGDRVTINGKDVRSINGDLELNGRVIIEGDKVIVPGMRGNINWIGSERAQLGVSSVDDAKGAKIAEVMEGTAAEKAGLKKDDIITMVGTTVIGNAEGLSTAIRKMKPEDEVDIAYIRDGKNKKVKAKLGKAEAGMAFRFNDMENELREFRIDPPMVRVAPRFRFDNGDMFFYQSDRPKFGMNVQDNEEGEGVLVNEVEADSKAEKAGLQKGDIITAVDGKPTPNLDELRTQLRNNMDKGKIAVEVQRKGARQTLQLSIPKRIETAEL